MYGLNTEITLDKSVCWMTKMFNILLNSIIMSGDREEGMLRVALDNSSLLPYTSIYLSTLSLYIYLFFKYFFYLSLYFSPICLSFSCSSLNEASDIEQQLQIRSIHKWVRRSNTHIHRLPLLPLLSKISNVFIMQIHLKLNSHTMTWLPLSCVWLYYPICADMNIQSCPLNIMVRFPRQRLSLVLAWQCSDGGSRLKVLFSRGLALISVQETDPITFSMPTDHVAIELIQFHSIRQPVPVGSASESPVKRGESTKIARISQVSSDVTRASFTAHRHIYSHVCRTQCPHVSSDLWLTACAVFLRERRGSSLTNWTLPSGL